MGTRLCVSEWQKIGGEGAAVMGAPAHQPLSPQWLPPALSSAGSSLLPATWRLGPTVSHLEVPALATVAALLRPCHRQPGGGRDSTGPDLPERP